MDREIPLSKRMLYERGWVAMLGAAVSACAPAPSPVDDVAIRTDTVTAIQAVTLDSTTLFPDAFAALLPRIARYEVVPSRLDLRVGEEFPIARLEVFAVDSLGGRLGKIVFLDRALEPGAAQLTPGAIRAVRAGEGVLEFRPSRLGAIQSGVPWPIIRVPIYVRE